MSDVAHQREGPRERRQVLPHDLDVALDLQAAVQRMRHRPDVVVHRRWRTLDELLPARLRRAERERVTVLRSGLVDDAVDSSVAEMHDVGPVFAEVEKHALVKVATDVLHDSVVVDAALPVLHPLRTELVHIDLHLRKPELTCPAASGSVLVAPATPGPESSSPRPSSRTHEAV